MPSFTPIPTPNLTPMRPPSHRDVRFRLLQVTAAICALVVAANGDLAGAQPSLAGSWSGGGNIESLHADHAAKAGHRAKADQSVAEDKSALAAKGTASLTLFNDLNLFFNAVDVSLTFESFEEGSVAAGEVRVCSDPYDSTTSDQCWSAGDIADRLQVASSSGSGVAILGPGVIGNDSIVTGADTFLDSTRLSFAEGGVSVLGLELASSVEEILTLLLLDSKENVLATAFVDVTLEPRFWGVISDEPFVHVDIVSENGELVDNVRFGPPPPRLEAEVTLLDRCVDPAANVNGILEPGEGIQMQLVLRAVGGDFHGVRALVSGPDGGLDSLLPSVGFGDISAGESSLRPIALQLDPQLACFSTQALRVEVISQEDAFVFDRLEDIGRLPIPQDLPQGLIDDHPVGTTSELQVVSGDVVTNLDVQVHIEHSWVGDLELRLTSPSGTTVQLLDRPGVPEDTFGCNRDDMEVLFQDDATVELEDLCLGNPWFVGSAQPLEPLSAFVGEPLDGTWRLTVIDQAPGDGGQLLQWRLLSDPPLEGQCAPCADSGLRLSPLDIPTLGHLGALFLALALAGLALGRLRST